MHGDDDYDLAVIALACNTCRGTKNCIRPLRLKPMRFHQIVFFVVVSWALGIVTQANAASPILEIFEPKIIGAGRASYDDRHPLMAIRDVQAAKLEADGKSVALSLTPKDTKKFAALTTSHLDGFLLLRATEDIIQVMHITGVISDGRLGFQSPTEENIAGYLRKRLKLTATVPPSEFTVGTTYDILRSVELHDGPGEKYDKKLNQVASDNSRQIEYLSVDPSTTVKVLDLKGDWTEVQVVEPTFFADTHRGWIPASALKSGKATHKRNGWITHTCFVYAQKDAKSKRIGYLSQGAAVNVVDDESGWLELPAWGVNPVQNSENNKFLLSEGLMKRAMYLEASNFTQTPPAPR